MWRNRPIAGRRKKRRIWSRLCCHGFFSPELFKAVLTKWGLLWDYRGSKLFQLPVLSLFKLPCSITGEHWSLNEHLGATLGLKWAVESLEASKAETDTVTRKMITEPNPDLPFLAFLDFLSFFVARNSLLFWAFFSPSFPGILGVRHSEKILVFWGGFPC